ncbi:unnamed protein product, partial [Chrysoparadoxa australica]
RDWLLDTLGGDDPEDEAVATYLAHRRKWRREQCKTFESDDYELYDSKVWHIYKNSGTSVVKAKRKARKNLLRALVLALALSAGLIGAFVKFTSKSLVKTKLYAVEDALHAAHQTPSKEQFIKAFFLLWGSNVAYGILAFLLVYIAPWSAGSGIPEVKCVLNGVSMPDVLSLKCMVCKLLGIIFAIASGVPVGKEGPMIHIGAGLGASIATSLPFRRLEQFKNDRDRRDFAAIGTAAGVSAAFRTPIGGVLFAMEEGASYWSTVLTWRAFAAACITVLTVWFTLYPQAVAADALNLDDVFLFGSFSAQAEAKFYLWELAFFVLMAIIGGILGPAFISCNLMLGRIRKKHITTWPRKLVEVFSIVTLVSSVSFWLPLVYSRCAPVPDYDELQSWSPAGIDSVKSLQQFNCEDGKFNPLATLFLNEGEQVIKMLFHYKGEGFTPATTLLFCCSYIMLTCVTFGASLCSGLFIPTLSSGAALGRAIGGLAGRNVSTASLMGAASLLGGVTRMTISITVILTEASGYVLFVVPLMLVFLVARSVGNRFNEGIYDAQITVKHIPFLDSEPPESFRQQNLRVHQVMSRDVKCLRGVETVRKVYRLLIDTEHNAFPIVDQDTNTLLGTVLRKHLLSLLAGRHFSAGSAEDPDKPESLEASHEGRKEVMTWKRLERHYPRYPRLSELDLAKEDMPCLIDLTPYLQIGPHIINEHASAHRAYTMFRTLGMRHMPVINHYNELVGIITRENLLSEHHHGRYPAEAAVQESSMPLS